MTGAGVRQEIPRTVDCCGRGAVPGLVPLVTSADREGVRCVFSVAFVRGVCVVFVGCRLMGRRFVAAVYVGYRITLSIYLSSP